MERRDASQCGDREDGAAALRVRGYDGPGGGYACLGGGRERRLRGCAAGAERGGGVA